MDMTWIQSTYIKGGGNWEHPAHSECVLFIFHQGTVNFAPIGECISISTQVRINVWYLDLVIKVSTTPQCASDLCPFGVLLEHKSKAHISSVTLVEVARQCGTWLDRDAFHFSGAYRVRQNRF